MSHDGERYSVLIDSVISHYYNSKRRHYTEREMKILCSFVDIFTRRFAQTRDALYHAETAYATDFKL